MAYDGTVFEKVWWVVPPSPHAQELAGWGLFESALPAVHALPARETVVVLSRSRDPAREVYLERCAADRVPVLVRPSGGGAVVLAEGALVANIVTRLAAGAPRPEREFARFCARAIAALAACGVAGVKMRGVSDLCLGERKVAGTALRLWQGLALFQISILVDMDLRLLDRYLPLPSREPAYRRGRAHLDFVTTLRAAGASVTVGDLAQALDFELRREIVI